MDVNKKYGSKTGKLLLFLVVFHVITLFFIVRPAKSGIYESAEEIIDKSKEGEFIAAGKRSIIPIPVPVSNPTLGTGLLAALIYLHPKDGNIPESPNVTSGMAAMYTSNKSWLAAAFHDGSLKSDKIRFSGFIGVGELNLKFYGIGDDPEFKDDPIDYSLEIAGFSPKILYRLFDHKKWFAGLSYLFISSKATFYPSPEIHDMSDFKLDFLMSGISLIGMYDSRNDNYYPTRGNYFEGKISNFAEIWGSDSNFNKFKFNFRTYRPFSSLTTLAFRTQLEMSEGDVPFFALSRLDMHGFSTSRYTDRHTLSVHGEIRHKFHPRWGVVGFVEAGQYASKPEDIFKGKTIISGGAGIRWQVIRDKSMHFGLEAAVSNDDSAIYVQIGENF